MEGKNDLPLSVCHMFAHFVGVGTIYSIAAQIANKIMDLMSHHNPFCWLQLSFPLLLKTR
jgi:hypothetical protein